MHCKAIVRWHLKQLLCHRQHQLLCCSLNELPLTSCRNAFPFPPQLTQQLPLDWLWLLVDLTAFQWLLERISLNVAKKTQELKGAPELWNTDRWGGLSVWLSISFQHSVQVLSLSTVIWFFLPSFPPQCPPTLLPHPGFSSCPRADVMGLCCWPTRSPEGLGSPAMSRNKL